MSLWFLFSGSIFGPIVLMILFALGFDFCFKNTRLKIHPLFSFTISYFLISLVLIYFQYKQPQAQYFPSVPIFGGPMLLSCPLGLILWLLHPSGVPGMALVVVGGTLQLYFYAFFYQKKQKGVNSRWIAVLPLVPISIFTVLTICLLYLLFILAQSL